MYVCIIYNTELDKAFSAHDLAYADSQSLAKRTISGKLSEDISYETDKNPEYDGCQRVLASTC